MNNQPKLPEIHGSLDKKKLAAVRKAFSDLNLSPEKRRALVKRIARQVIVKTRANLRAQQTPDGSKWQPRRSKAKQKMLRKLGTALMVQEIDGGSGARVFFSGSIKTKKNRVVSRPGYIAKFQQEGVTASYTGRMMEKEKKDTGNISDKESARKKPASNGQIRALVKLGVKRKTAKLFTVGIAGSRIRDLRGKPAKQSWTAKTPGRKFLGITDDQAKTIIAEQIKRIGFGAPVSKSQIRSK